MTNKESLQNILTNIREQFNIFSNKIKDTNFMRFVSSSIKTIDNVIKAIETVLKNRGIDIDKYKEKTQEFGRKVKSKTLFAIDTIKEIGKETFNNLKPDTQNRIIKAKDTIMNMINRFKTSPPEEENIELEEKQSLFSKLDNYLEERRNKILEEKIRKIEERIKDIRRSKLLSQEEKDALIAKLVEEKIKYDELLLQDKRYFPRITNFFTDRKNLIKQSLLNTKNKITEMLFKFRNDRIKAKIQRLEDKIKEIENNKNLTNDEKIRLIEKIMEKENLLNEDLEDATLITQFLKRRLNIFTDKITSIKNKISNSIKNKFNTIKDKISNKINTTKQNIKYNLIKEKEERLKTELDDLKNRIETTEDPIKKEKLINKLVDKEKEYRKTRVNRRLLLTKSKKKPKENTIADMAEKATAKAKGKLNILFKGIELIGGLFSSLIDVIKPKSTEDRIKDDIERTNKEIARQEKKLKKRRGILNKIKEKTEKPKEDSGFFGKLLNKLLTFGGFLLGGLKTLLWSTTKWLGGFLFKSIGKIFSGIIPSLVKNIGNFIKGLFNPTNLIKGGWKALKTGFKSLKPTGGTALRIAGQIGLTALRFAGPIGAVITVGYLAWKFYKYLTRNDLKDGIPGKLTKLRLMQYGLNDENKDEYYKIFELEMKLKNNIRYSREKIEIESPNEDMQREIFELFNIGEDDKEKKQIFETWYKNRFMYVFSSHIKALYNINSHIYLDELDKLKPEEFKKYMETFITNTRIYSFKQLPLDKSTETTVTKEKVDELIVEIRKLIEKEIGKKVEEPKTVGQKTLSSSTAKPNENKTNLTQKSKTSTKSIETPNNTSSKLLNTNITDDSEPTTIEKVIENTRAKVTNIGRLNKAEGELIPGSNTLTGININKIGTERYYNLDPNIIELFSGMAKEYNMLTGKEIQVNEAFRTYDDQARLYEKTGGKAAPPGSSLHEKGLAIDIPTVIADELERLGLLRKYGFTRPVGAETWHLEPIGISLDPARAKEDLEFRRTAILASPGKGGGGYGVETRGIKEVQGTRNIPLQKAIYNTNAENKIDVAKVLDRTIQNIAKNENLNITKKDIEITENKGLLSKNIEERLPNMQLENTSKIQYNTTPKVVKENIENKEGISFTSSRSFSTNTNFDLGKYKNISIDESITLASRLTGVDEKILRTFAQLESGFRANAKASTSSAKGLMQFVDDTWKEMVTKYGPRYGIPSNATQDNPLYSSIMAAEYIRENLNYLSKYKNNVNLNDGIVAYLAHHFGPNDTRKILSYYSYNPNIAMASVIDKKAYEANKSSIGNKSVREYIASLQNKFNTAYQIANDTNREIVTASITPQIRQNVFTYPTTSGSNSLFALNTNTNVIKTSTLNSRDISSPKETLIVNKPSTTPIATNTIKFDTGNVETLLNQQLNTLNTVVSILANINDKIDINKFSNMLLNKNDTMKINNDIKLSNTNVSLKRGNIT